MYLWRGIDSDGLLDCPSKGKSSKSKLTRSRAGMGDCMPHGGQESYSCLGVTAEQGRLRRV